MKDSKNNEESETQARGRLERYLDGTFDHFRCYFPRKSKGVISALLRIPVLKIRFRKEQSDVIRDISDDAIIVYAHKYKSYFEYLFYHTRYQSEGLPVPEIGFDYKFFLLQPLSRISRILIANILFFFKHFSFNNPYRSGYIRRTLMEGRAGMLSLVEKGGFYLRFVKSNPDPLRYLLEMQEEIDRPVLIVPQLMFFSKKPHRSTPTLIDILFGTEERPGMFRRIFALIKKPENIFVEISEPVDLRKFARSPENRDLSSDQKALKLRRKLLVQLNRHRQSITGPTLKTHEELKENILTNDRLRSFMENFSETRNTPIYKVYKEADGYIDEIAARYSVNKIQIFSTIVRWLMMLMFEGVSVNTDVLGRVKSVSRKGPLILIPCHKSHIDYLILSYILFQNDMPCPHIAAGKNLSFWPLGPIFRGGGAFFIRRTFRGAVLYSKVFSEYVHKLLEEGFNIEFFIEGGRSRTGKLLQPKLGLLSILLNAYKSGACRDMIFVPVFIGYDRVLEESAYLHELEGGQKKPESLSQVIKARKFLKKRYGRIYIRFHEPFSINELLAREGQAIPEMTSKEQNTFCRELGYRVTHAIDKVTVVTPHAIMASVILNNGRPRFTYDELMADVETYMNYLNIQKVQLADTLLMDQANVFEYVFESYVQRKFIEVITDKKDADPLERQFVINDSRRSALDYYRNNCISMFVPAAFTALAILEKDVFQFSGSDIYGGYRFLQEMFENEFFSDIDRPPEHYVHKNIKAFIDEAILIPHPSLPDTYNLTSVGYRKLKLYAAFLASFFESYWVVLTFFSRYPRDFVDAKDRIKKVQSMSLRMLKRTEITRTEAVSKINFKNAMDFFLSHGIKGSEDEERIQFYMTAVRRYLKLA